MSHYYDDVAPTAKEIEEERIHRELQSTPISELIAKNITLSELRDLLNNEFPYTAIALARKRKFVGGV